MAELSARTTLAPPVSVKFAWHVEGVTPAFFTGAVVGSRLDSPAFNALGKAWQLFICPNGYGAEYAGNVGLYLQLITPNCESVSPALVLQLGNKTVKFADKTYSTMKPKPDNTSPAWGPTQLLAHAELLASPELYFPDGVLTLSVTVSEPGNTAAKSSAVEEKCQLPALPPSSLLAELSTMLSSGQGADVTLLCGSERIPAHAAILCARSPVLCAQLRGPLACPLSAVPVPAEIDAPTLRRTLEFIYTDECEPRSAEEAQHLLNAADHYGTTRLRSICERFLSGTLSVENAAFTLTLAEQHSAGALRNAALRFVAKNAVAVMKTEGWAHLKASSPALVDAALFTSATGEPPEPQEEAEAAEGSGRRVRRRTR